MRALSSTPNTSKPPPPSTSTSRQSTLTSTSKPDVKGLNPRKKPPIPILSTTTPSGPRTARITARTTATTPRSRPSATAGAPATATSRPGSRATTPVSRPALRPRDQNVAPATTRSMRLTQNPKSQPSTTTSSKMPFERASASSNNNNNNNNPPNRQPSMPALARSAGKQPLTPKIATTGRSSTPQHQTVTVSTPLSRRAPRPESVLINHAPAPRDRDREDVASPVPPLLANNITPRSGSRQIRVDSANSTPNGTPQLDRHDTWESKSGLGISATGAEPRHLSVTFSQPEPTVNASKPSVESKFFYASDAPRQAPPSAAPSPRTFVAPQQKQSAFFYANGNSVPDNRQPAPPPAMFSPALAAPASQDSLRSKFVYADGTSDVIQPPTRSAFSPGPGSTVSTSSKMPTSRPGTGVSSTGYMGQRPVSPIKLSSYPPVLGGSNHNFAPLRSPVLPSCSGPDTRRTSGDSAPRYTAGGHSRTGSVTSNLTMAEPPAVARLMSAHGTYSPSEISSPVSFSNPGFTLITSNPATSGFASLLQAADEFAGDEEDEDEDYDEEDDEEDLEIPQSPNKDSPHDNQLNELVVSARRERKVQDLQITNASLEAINRTLERQLRKQTAELRRYRRLSRSGRLSMASLGGRDRIVSDSSVEGGGLARAGMGLDDLSEEESELEAEEEEEDYSDSDACSGELSPNAMTARDARHRRRDEQRLELDLSKHQQLLIDSQKMNQSLKRCLGWTEELIKEGKRALEYQVRVSEVNIGGRVLAPEDIEGNDDESEVGEEDRSQELRSQLGGTAHSTNVDQQQSKDAQTQDRDNGVELPQDGG